MFLHSVLARVGLMHIGVFILLLLSGERNFGVRLNKPYSVRVPMDIPVFTGTHADFLIIVSQYFTSSKMQYKFLAAEPKSKWRCDCFLTVVILHEMNLTVFCYMCITLFLQVFHKIITTGHQRLQPLFDCLLTIIVNGIYTNMCHLSYAAIHVFIYEIPVVWNGVLPGLCIWKGVHFFFELFWVSLIWMIFSFQYPHIWRLCQWLPAPNCCTYWRLDFITHMLIWNYLA